MDFLGSCLTKRRLRTRTNNLNNDPCGFCTSRASLKHSCKSLCDNELWKPEDWLELKVPEENMYAIKKCPKIDNTQNRLDSNSFEANGPDLGVPDKKKKKSMCICPPCQNDQKLLKRSGCYCA